MLGRLQHAAQPSPEHFVVTGFSAGSYTGAVIASAIRCLWPQGQITARLGGSPSCYGRCKSAPLLNLVHAGSLCDWKPSDQELQIFQRNLHVTYVDESARWMPSTADRQAATLSSLSPRRGLPGMLCPFSSYSPRVCAMVGESLPNAAH